MSLGDYHILKEMGGGALGRLLLVQHRFLKKKSLLKLLPESLSQEKEFVTRLEAAMLPTSQLHHQHILPLSTISSAEGRYFLVYDLPEISEEAEIEDLAFYLTRKKGEAFSEEAIRDILSPIAEALDYAHQLTIFHQALNLHAIFLCHTSSRPHLFLGDFGLASIFGAAQFVALVLTGLVQSMAHSLDASREEISCLAPNFTPCFAQIYPFLAPEQKQAEKALIGSAPDSYAFGVLSYYLLTHHFPEGCFPLPSEKTRELNYDWDYLVKSCLALEPSMRPEQLVPLLERKKNPLLASYPISHADPLPEWVRNPSLRHAETSVRERAEQKASLAFSFATSAAAVATPGLVAAETEPEVAAVPNSPPASVAAASRARLYQPEPAAAQNSQPLSTEMVWIPAGTYLRGSNQGQRDEMPIHKVILTRFAIDIHPVTNAQFVRFLNHLGSEQDKDYNDVIRFKESRIHRMGGKLGIESGYAHHPVVGVTWYGAYAYALWIGKRLPSEAEWEVAARGGMEEALYPTGKEIHKQQANFFSADTQPVMNYPPNGYGLYDMGGNVYEWCQDWYSDHYYEISLQEPYNPKGPLQGTYRILRGGCWKSLADDLRCAHRHRNNPGTVNNTYGFRCAVDVSNEE